MRIIYFTFALILSIHCSKAQALNSAAELVELPSSGLSGLRLESVKGDTLVFWSHSDRGPNLEAIEDGNGVIKRPFLRPDFQPYWVKFSFNRKTKELRRLEVLGLTLSDGTPLTGLPNKSGDEVPVDLNGRELAFDINGIDPESMCFDGRHIWMGEEYGPSLLKFSLKGQLLRRYVPLGTYSGASKELVQATLPADMAKRKLNRGFEGIACYDGMIWAILQSPLPGEGANVRMIAFDPSSEKVQKQLLYPLESKKIDRIGDMVAMGDSLLIIEQDGKSGSKSSHKVFELDMKGANGVSKKLRKDLVKAGFSFAEKVEGIMVIGQEQIAVVNDNDFGVFDSSHKSVLGMMKLD